MFTFTVNVKFSKELKSGLNPESSESVMIEGRVKDQRSRIAAGLVHNLNPVSCEDKIILLFLQKCNVDLKYLLRILGSSKMTKD